MSKSIVQQVTGQEMPVKVGKTYEFEFETVLSNTNGKLPSTKDQDELFAAAGMAAIELVSYLIEEGPKKPELHMFEWSPNVVYDWKFLTKAELYEQQQFVSFEVIAVRVFVKVRATVIESKGLHLEPAQAGLPTLAAVAGLLAVLAGTALVLGLTGWNVKNVTELAETPGGFMLIAIAGVLLFLYLRRRA